MSNTAIATGTDLVEGFNVQLVDFAGHKPWVVTFVFADGRAKILHSADTKGACTRWINRKMAVAA